MFIICTIYKSFCLTFCVNQIFKFSNLLDIVRYGIKNKFFDELIKSFVYVEYFDGQKIIDIFSLFLKHRLLYIKSIVTFEIHY